MNYYIHENGEYKRSTLAEVEELFRISDESGEFEIDIKKLENTLYSIVINKQSYLVEGSRLQREVSLILNQFHHKIPVLNERQKIESEIMGSAALTAGEGEIRAPMPGLIIKVEVEEGQEIKAGDPLLIMEAMKMENEIRSPMPGTVQKIFIHNHAKVEKDDLLITIGK
jgi:biotin carboxyl carrier protein